jgi:hypothetical protein
MKWHPALLLLLLLVSRLPAQTAAPIEMLAPPPTHASGPCPVPCQEALWNDSPAGEPLRSNRNFSNFIGFMSNPLQNVDPRALTQIQPIFLGAWVTTTQALPDLSAQVYGPAISVALTERLGVGLNQGGYTFIQVDRNDPRRPLLNDGRHPLLAGRLRDRGQQFGGTREGFLNMGGYAQYTFIEDVENQFLATGGLRLVVPAGSTEVFQGKGPAYAAPYLTIGQEFGQFHFLATGGYQFPLRSGERELELGYLNAHLDRQFFGWVYPLVEANFLYHSASVPAGIPTRIGFIDLGNFGSTGNTATVAVGVNLVLIRDRLEIGGAYVRSVATQHNVDVDAMILKMTLRY